MVMKRSHHADFNSGLVLGVDVSGQSAHPEWDERKALALDHLMSEVTSADLSVVSLSSVPSRNGRHKHKH
jgi:hypothetical protein